MTDTRTPDLEEAKQDSPHLAPRRDRLSSPSLVNVSPPHSPQSVPVDGDGPTQGAAATDPMQQILAFMAQQQMINAAILSRLEVRDTRAQPVDAPSTPSSQPLPSHTAVPLSATSAVQSSTARRQLFAPPARVIPFSSPSPLLPRLSEEAVRAAPSLSPAAESNPPRSEALAAISAPHRYTKVSAPDKFRGTDKERMGSREWLKQASVYLYFTAGHLATAEQIAIFGLLLEDGARTWFYNCQEREGSGWSLQDVFDAFLETYAGGLTKSLLEAELAGLRYQGEKTRDLATLNARFDSLTSQLYPGGWRDETASRLLASKYEAIIKAGDFELWDKAADSRPVGLDAWKAAVQDAYVRLSESRREKVRHGRFSTNLTGFRPQPTSAAITVNGMQVEGKVEQTWERAEGEEEALSGEAALYKMQAGKAKLGNRGKGKGKPSTRLYTDEEYERMKKTDLCLYCAKKGHRISACPDKAEGKPRTKATPEQLKE